MLEYLDHIKDDRVECYSVLLKIKISDYLNFIEKAYKNKGGIAGQRSPLKTKSAQRIRKRLIEDLQRGTVIPAIVLGVRLENGQFENFIKDIKGNITGLFGDGAMNEQMSIIDGMQRTTALYEASLIKEFDKEKIIRLELWVAKSTNSLIYRMLVLNSGQIPWSIKRQLEVVFSQLTKELTSNVPDLSLFTSEEEGSRTKAGEFQASQFIELFILFGTKRMAVDIQEELAEEFARLDIIETSGNDKFMEIFYGVSSLLVELDKAFSLLTETSQEIELVKFKTGKHIFSSQPARAGFFVAVSQEIFGLPGVDVSEEEQSKRFKNIQSSVLNFIEGIRAKSQSELSEIIDLSTLDEQINVKSSKVGEFERTFFLKSFKTFIDLSKSNSLSRLTPCWRSSH